MWSWPLAGGRLGRLRESVRIQKGRREEERRKGGLSKGTGGREKGRTRLRERKGEGGTRDPGGRRPSSWWRCFGVRQDNGQQRDNERDNERDNGARVQILSLTELIRERKYTNLGIGCC